MLVLFDNSALSVELRRHALKPLEVDRQRGELCLHLAGLYAPQRRLVRRAGRRALVPDAQALRVRLVLGQDVVLLELFHSIALPVELCRNTLQPPSRALAREVLARAREVLARTQERGSERERERDKKGKG